MGRGVVGVGVGDALVGAGVAAAALSALAMVTIFRMPRNRRADRNIPALGEGGGDGVEILGQDAMDCCKK